MTRRDHLHPEAEAVLEPPLTLLYLESLEGLLGAGRNGGHAGQDVLSYCERSLGLELFWKNPWAMIA